MTKTLMGSDDLAMCRKVVLTLMLYPVISLINRSPALLPIDLRVRTVAKRHMRSSMFTASYSGFMCQTTVIFGITKDGSHVLNILAS